MIEEAIVLAAAMVAFAISALARVGSDMFSEEIRGWVEHLPDLVLRTAAMRLGHDQRLETYRDEWLPELLYITRQTEGRPISRLLRAMRFSLGMLWSARRQARELSRLDRRKLASIQAATESEEALRSRRTGPPPTPAKAREVTATNRSGIVLTYNDSYWHFCQEDVPATRRTADNAVHAWEAKPDRMRDSRTSGPNAQFKTPPMA